MQAREQASPTHTLSAQGNMARLQEAIPVLYGRHMVFPDFAAQPYTETDSNNTYLYQLFCLGQGELDIERIRIEETPIENFAEVSWEVVRPGGLVTLFPDNVVTSSIVQGLELKGSNEEGGGWMGPYVTNPAGTRANVIGIDISLPQGLYYANDEGGLDGATVSWRIEVRPINDEGAPAGEWTLLGEERWGEATATPQIKSFRYEVPDGRFEVRAMRIGTKNLDQRCANTVSWAGLRAYLPSTQSYGDVTLLAVAMRATNNLNQSTSRRINVIATRKLHVWDPVAGWSQDVRATRNPAWALADMLRSRVYGRGMLDTAYNLPELYRLAQVWEQRRDYYDDVIDTTMTLWDALSRAARVGRAVPMYYAGLIDFVRNEPRSIPRAMFTPDNIVDGSFSINYSFIEHDSPDHVVIEYVDSETWQPAEVACVLPGGTQERPARVQLPGVTNRDQAWREGISMAAANRDQRIAPSLQTELDGHIPNFLDLVTVVHDTPKWGLSGFVTAWDPATRRLQVSEPLEWYVGQQHYISLRQRDGTPRGPFRVTAGRDELECVLVSPPSDLYVSEGEIEEPTLYAFGPGERTGLKALVRRAVPDESGHVTLELVNYADSVHSAELGGEVPPPPPASLLPLTPDAPIVAEVTVYATASPSEQIASCTPARGAETYEFEASQDQGQSWTRLGADTIPSLTIHLPVGPWWVRARGVGKNPGPWKTWQGHISATMLPPPVLTHFVASPVLWGIRLAWTWPTAIRLRYIEIWYSRTPSFLDATPMGQFAYPQGSHELTNLAITTELYFWARVRDEADQPGPWYPESGPGVRGTPNQVASEYNDLVTQEIVEGGLGDLIMGNIREIPNIRDSLSATEWDRGASYKVGAVVFAEGRMYRAIQDVPAGVAVHDARYWESIGKYADGLDAYAGALEETAARIDEVEGASASKFLVLNAESKRRASQEDAELERVLNQWQTRASLSEFKNVQADENRALAESITTLTAAIGQGSAAVEEIMRSLVELDGKISASWGIKLQANANGVQYVAGVGLDLTNESGVMQSTFAVLADRFAVMHSVNGNPVTVFSVQNGASILNTALIGYASIGQAHIADAAISRAKIQWAAIGEAQIENASITNAKIVDASITRAKIGIAEVDTLRIAGNAVTMHAARSGSGSLTISTPHGGVANIMVFYPGFASATATHIKVVVRLNGSVIAEIPALHIDFVNNDEMPDIDNPVSRVISAWLAAGNNTIDVWATGVGWRPGIGPTPPSLLTHVDTVVLFNMR